MSEHSGGGGNGIGDRDIPRTTPASAEAAEPSVSELKAERDALRHQVDEYEASTSWRVTAPLRSATSRVRALRGAAAAKLSYRTSPGPRFVPPGHFYSPIPNLEEVRADADRIFAPPPASLPGIDLNDAGQTQLLNEIRPFYDEIPWSAERQAGLRYFFDNPNFGYADAIMLYSMLRRLRPRRIVEIGSGYSSAVTLDTNERFLDWAATCTFVEPYPELLRSLLHDGDQERITIVEARAQDAPMELFTQLEATDVLFIDSTHVSKIGSDVNREIFEILPSVAPGVFIHIHDMFVGFEYPRQWVEEGRAWTEDYLVRAFLMYNHDFQVVAFNSYLSTFHRDWLEQNMPLLLRNTGSLWLKRV